MEREFCPVCGYLDCDGDCDVPFCYDCGESMPWCVCDDWEFGPESEGNDAT